MTPDRWTLALEDGDMTWPEAGAVLVLRARAGADFDALGRDRVQAVQGFAPDHDRLDQLTIPALVQADLRDQVDGKANEIADHHPCEKQGNQA